jgi:hypothetical protein
MKKIYFTASLFAATFALKAQNIDATKVIYFKDGIVVGSNIGQVPITTSNNYKLLVTGGILTEKLRIAQKSGTAWADYVFNPEYKLLSISQVQQYVRENGHLPDVPSATQVQNEGLDIADTQRILLQKIEEQMLYIFQQEKRIKALETKMRHIQSRK